MVLLVGNYPPDRLLSMDRFARMMLQGLTDKSIAARLITPRPRLGIIPLGAFLQKWLGYIDKFLFFPRELSRQTAGVSLIHICDHSNAPYVRNGSIPTVITCHDLLAVRSGLGEESDHPASVTGRILQRWILRSLRRATAVICVSDATRRDAERLIRTNASNLQLATVRLAPDTNFRPEPPAVTKGRLSLFPALDLTRPFLLHVGSNLRRKNREGVLRIFARVQELWPGQLVIAGDALNKQLSALANELGIAGRIVRITGPSDEELSALYNCARALLYPSRSEGFGWPIIEAQSCGCPVVCSNSDPLPEVAGSGALMRRHDDEAGFGNDLLRLLEPAEFEHWRAQSLENARRFSPSTMIRQYIEIYRSLVPAL